MGGFLSLLLSGSIALGGGVACPPPQKNAVYVADAEIDVPQINPAAAKLLQWWLELTGSGLPEYIMGRLDQAKKGPIQVPGQVRAELSHDDPPRILAFQLIATQARPQETLGRYVPSDPEGCSTGLVSIKRMKSLGITVQESGSEVLVGIRTTKGVEHYSLKVVKTNPVVGPEVIATTGGTVLRKVRVGVGIRIRTFGDHVFVDSVEPVHPATVQPYEGTGEAQPAP